MKKMILLSSIFAAGALFADNAAPTSTEVASTEVGVMGISISQKATLIAVPFLGYGVTETDIMVADMVNTAQLDLGSKLYAPNASGQYNVWELQSGTDNTKVWAKTAENVTISSAGVRANVTPSADAVTTARGGAFWLEPANESGTQVYLLGKPASDEGKSSSLAIGKWNMIGNTSKYRANLKTFAAAKRDQIAIQVEGNFRYYTYNGGWCYQDNTGEWQRGKENEGVDLFVEIGQGLWFKPATSGISPTEIDWDTYAVKPQVEQ